MATAILLGTPAPPVWADDAIGAYLAARQARYDNDFAAAAQYFTQALAKDPSNPEILESATVAHMSLGDLDRAVPIARKIEADGLMSQVAFMALVADEAKREDYQALFTRIEEDRGVGMLADGLIKAWAFRGEGQMDEALTQFDAVANERGLRSFAIYHKALALASVGDYESAEKIFSGEVDGPIQRTRLGTIAWAEILSQLERGDDAVAILEDTFGPSPDPEIADLRDRLTAGETLPFTRVRTAQDGIAEVFFTLGQALMSESADDYTLLYARVAEYLKPDHIDALLMTAELLESLERFELANDAYARVPRDHPNFHVAELGRAESLRRAEKTDAAVEVLTQLSESHPELPIVHVSTGDLYRQLENWEKSIAAYDRAIEIYDARDQGQWFVHYARAISHERLDNWDAAEADFRRALELNPGQPQVLNYLGYSMVELQINLDEALGMIEEAVAAQPNSGYIVDSLGWVLYRLGRYEEAVVHMERAVELEPVDPVINDHLGDVLWAVGRFTEAEFQWKRALSFVDAENASPDVDADRIRRKLEVGLDIVLEEEGSPPLRVADDG
ncbi:tetratricopeptide repeat protein [Roseovarius faecimaris]|uniref:tetratricopeptide repeat protein n=1 Tax=Roseovarius faecimaris TaxID=2494550 RepID=UPI001FE2C882|nr:tetratricopeptide repeat protein [Roseovarius faecimaris]